ncbi:MAG TPA: uroporphyrinogen-III synthase [Stellaceae bacterium]|nr:uroporphyrinogen-III synthase [Stellaceae bacterium]
MAGRGLRALVTRPQEESETLAAALAARDIEVVIEPLLAIDFRESQEIDLAGVQAILCTSANGVRALARASSERKVPVLAVGDATAFRARAEGFVFVESAAGNITDLVHLAAAALRPQGGPLLHVAGNVVAGDLAAALRAEGYVVERRVLYEARAAVALSPTAIDALRAGSLNFILFFSPRTAATFVTLAESARVMECCRTITALSISAAADAAVSGLPWLDRYIADRPNQTALLAALDSVLRERRDAGTGIRE